MAKTEKKKLDNLINDKENEKMNLTYSLFLKDQSSVLLVDGYSNMGKILYVTPNIENIYDYKVNELMNGSIDYLIPKTIAEIHNELIENTIRFSRLEKIFKKPLETSIKGKRN